MDCSEKLHAVQPDFPVDDPAEPAAEVDGLIDIRQPGELKARDGMLWPGAVTARQDQLSLLA